MNKDGSESKPFEERVVEIKEIKYQIMSKQETFNIGNLMLLDSQNKIKDRVKKGAIAYVGDEHFAQATEILERHQISYGIVREEQSGSDSIIIH